MPQSTTLFKAVTTGWHGSMIPAMMPLVRALHLQRSRLLTSCRWCQHSLYSRCNHWRLFLRWPSSRLLRPPRWHVHRLCSCHNRHIHPMLLPQGNLAVFLVGRCIIGVGQGISLTAGPVYIGELSPPHIRGKIMSFWQLFYSVGSFICFWVNYGQYLYKGTALGNPLFVCTNYRTPDTCI